MDTNTKPRSIQSITNAVKSGKITFDSYLQRKEGQWSPLQKSKLIDSILRGYPIPAVYAIVPSAGVESIIDGCQRITTICDYVNGKFALSNELKPLKENEITVSINKKKFSALDDIFKERILNMDLVVITLSNYTEDELVDVFDRLNGGTALSVAQKNKVFMNFEFASMISRIAEKPALNNSLSKTQIKRDEHQSVVVQALMLIASEYTFNSFSKTDTKKFLKEYVPNYRIEDLDTVSAIIDVLETVIPEESKTIKKAMLPPIIKALKPIYNDPEKVKKFKNKLDKFLVDPSANKEYMKYATMHTTTKENVEGRVAFFEKMAK